MESTRRNNRMEFKKEKAIGALNEYVMTGAHAEKTECTNNNDKAKEQLKSLLMSGDQKRKEYNIAGHKIIAKFVPKEVKVVNHKGLISDILDYVRSEALSQVISLDKNVLVEKNLFEMVEEFLYEPTYYFKYTPNKFAKSFNYTVSEDYFGLPEEELVSRVMFTKERKNILKDYYERVMQQFVLMVDEKLTTDVGSISRIKNKPVWDIHAISKQFGDEFLIEYGNVKTTELTKWIDMKAIPKQVLSDNENVIDIRLDFMVMTEEAEARAMSAFQRIQSQKALLKYA